MSKFDEYFSGVQHFTNNSLVISGAYSVEKAAQLIGHYTGEDIKPSDLCADKVRYGFVPIGVVEDSVYHDGSCWYTGANGRGSKAVWVLER